MTEICKPQSWRPLLMLGLILVAAATLRLHAIGRASMWFDERASVMSSAGHFGDWMNLPLDRVIDPPDFWSVSHQRLWLDAWRSPDFHPPLYAMVLRVWRDCFGEGDVTVRVLSVVTSLAAIVCLFDLGRTLVGVGPALWACAIMAVAQPEIQYAQGAGMRDGRRWDWPRARPLARLAVNGPGWRRATTLTLC